MTAQQLKNSILQMAVQGKLVPQDPGDEPASVLLERIKAEKQELIKAGKIKKDKKSSEIFRGATHNLPYAYCEQVGKEIRDISDEIPFEIPESWCWTKIGTIFNLQAGKNIASSEIKDNRFTNSYPCYGGNGIRGYVSCTNHSGDYPIIGRQGALCGNVNRAIGDFYATEHAVCVDTFANTSVSWACLFLKALNLNQYATATAQPGLAVSNIVEVYIPLPPFSEQQRIVSKIEELLPYIEAYEKAETQLTVLNTSFSDMLKKSILQEAVQGKLVPQNPNDEPASVLLERIRAEKQELIKQGKIKKDKHESVIVTRDKIPYEIPDSWEWCKLSDLAILENGDRSSKYPVEADYVESGIPFFGAKDIDGEMMSFQNVRFISQQKYDELGNGKLVDGDIICLLRGSVGKTAKFEANEQFNTGFICAQMLIIRLLDKSLFGYISSYFKSPDYTNYVESKVTGTAVRQMPAKEMGNLLIPLPPLNEQHRIVAKIEEIMPYINTITK